MQFKQVEYPRGNPLKICGQDWIFAPAPLGALEKYQDFLGADVIPFNVIIDLAHISLKRNYPEIDRQYVADELIDVANMQDVIELIIQTSGLKQNDQAQSSGE
ncbi:MULTISPECIES: hypothetical protein [unclassified Acinetobacter]|uniref:hypothetical protein n=1 Tax=unclassified Acinetobacter TaxID=196816 RepID=UPI0029348B9D|nr:MULTISPECIES: hypothetical protein [unclassified Acinetobacter]WOE31981.1 hypothetical protein QSG84_01775 [Acinetobacter sp. SAAs470]WOE37449.1 hypothetical protein QSG86_10820 [Acinetobacter sp. SAAs474]